MANAPVSQLMQAKISALGICDSASDKRQDNTLSISPRYKGVFLARKVCYRDHIVMYV